MPFKRFNPDAEVYGHEMGNLPHWRQWGCTYFVTSRLTDSIPASLRVEWQAKRDAWLAAHGVTDPESLPEQDRRDYHRKFTAAFHALLDAGHGECHLARAECAEIVAAHLFAGHDRAYCLDAWVIMPNHIHALIEPCEDTTLGQIVKSWKGGSAREINVLVGRRGTLWQREPFDHIVRSGEQMEYFRRYVAQNPTKAGLRKGYTLGFGAERK